MRDYSGQGLAFCDSIGQYAIASFIELFHYKARVFSGTVLECKKVIEDEVKKHKVPIVGFYSASDNIRVVANVIKWIKKEYGITTLVGGPQAIALEKNFFEETGNDYVIVGEGEIPVKMLLDALIDKEIPLEDVPSLLYLKEGQLLKNPQENAIIQQLDMIPIPKMEHSIGKKLRQDSMVGILTGRGCPYSCSFCYEGQSTNLRFRSISHVMEEIDDIIANNPRLRYVNVYDDTFTIDKERVREFCKEMKQRNIQWFCEGHIRFVLNHPEMIPFMVEHGLVCVQFGLESGSDQVLEAYNKKTNAQMMVRAIDICKKAGVACVTGNFIIGGALETRETLEETKKIIKSLIDVGSSTMDLHLVYLASYPNTRIQKNPQDFQLNFVPQLQDWNIYTMQTPVVETDHLSVHDIYLAMKEIDSYMTECYYEVLRNCTKSDFLQSMYRDGKFLGVNTTWERLFSTDSRFRMFSDHLSPEEQEFDSKKYPIRTFDDFSVSEGCLHSKYGLFDGLEMDFLLHSNGVYTNEQIAKKLDVSVSTIESTYLLCNEKCLVYNSDF